jgi:hypothetical protein
MTVLGGKKNIFEIGQAIEEAYGFKPEMKRQGSPEDVYTIMQRVFAKDPSNVYAWLALQVLPSSKSLPYLPRLTIRESGSTSTTASTDRLTSPVTLTTRSTPT